MMMRGVGVLGRGEGNGKGMGREWEGNFNII